MKHKDHYNDEYIFRFSQKILSVMPDFDEKNFCHSLTGRLEDKELFARLDCIVDAMQESMPDDYSKNIQAFFNMLGPELEGIPKKERYERARQLMESGGLSGFENKYPFELSGGMRKRAIILRALAHDPEIIFMDEPFGPLDVFTREALQQEILRIWSQKKLTIVYITHDITEAVSLADRIIVMSRRPSTVQREVPVRLSRPRDVVEIRYEQEFMELEREIGAMIRGIDPEVRRSDE